MTEKTNKNNVYEFPSRVDGRSLTQMRRILIAAGISPYSAGSSEVVLGSTRVLTGTSINPNTEAGDACSLRARVQMLPHALSIAGEDPLVKEALAKQLGKVENLILKAIDAAIPKHVLNGLQITTDCSIVCSDSGVATAAIAGAWVSLFQALRLLVQQGDLPTDLHMVQVAAISASVVEGRCLVDPSAEEASKSEFTCKFIFDAEQKLIDLQAGRETKACDLTIFQNLIPSISQQAELIFKEQKRAVSELR